MFKLIKRLFRWALYLVILVVVLIVAAILLRDTIVKQVGAKPASAPQRAWT